MAEVAVNQLVAMNKLVRPPRRRAATFSDWGVVMAKRTWQGLYLNAYEQLVWDRYRGKVLLVWFLSARSGISLELQQKVVGKLQG